MNIKTTHQIEFLNTNDIDGFRMSDDETKVIMTMKDASEIEFSFINGFDIFWFYDLLDRIAGKQLHRTVYTSTSGFLKEAEHAMLLKNIRSICKAAGVHADPEDIHSIMLDGFHHRNLVSEAKKSGTLEQKVHTALNKFNELNGKVGVIYAN